MTKHFGHCMETRYWVTSASALPTAPKNVFSFGLIYFLCLVSPFYLLDHQPYPSALFGLVQSTYTHPEHYPAKVSGTERKLFKPINLNRIRTNNWKNRIAILSSMHCKFMLTCYMSFVIHSSTITQSLSIQIKDKEILRPICFVQELCHFTPAVQ